MITILARVVFIAAAVVALPTADALSRHEQLVLTLSGEGYKGPPAFSLYAGDRQLMVGSVRAAIDTEAGGRLTLDNISGHLQTFYAPLPDDIAAGNVLELRFTNNLYGGPGTNLDRNLFVINIKLNGQIIGLDQLKLRREGAVLAKTPGWFGAVVMTNSGDTVLITLPKLRPESISDMVIDH